jgi:hypothetical protein
VVRPVDTPESLSKEMNTCVNETAMKCIHGATATDVEVMEAAIIKAEEVSFCCKYYQTAWNKSSCYEPG